MSVLFWIVCFALQPNMNTYRVLLNACQRTDQGALAFEIYAVMRSKRLPILQDVRGKEGVGVGVMVKGGSAGVVRCYLVRDYSHVD